MRFVLLSTWCMAVVTACGDGSSLGAGDYGSSDEPADMLGMTAAHNQVRAEARPTPSPALLPLQWSSTLADIAREYAEGCRFEHSRNDLGENLYAESGQTSSPEAVVNSWGSEAAFYDYATNGCAGGEQCGHYTQIVWSDTRYVGCGRARCTSNSPFGSSQPWSNWVCNYDPPGNFRGERPY